MTTECENSLSIDYCTTVSCIASDPFVEKSYSNQPGPLMAGSLLHSFVLSEATVIREP